MISRRLPPFGSNPQLVPSFLADGPVISNDGTVVYFAGLYFGGVKSSIFSSDGTVTRLLMVTYDHTYQPLAVSVSGNGMMVTHLGGGIIDVHDGTVGGQFDPCDEFHAGSGSDVLYHVSISNQGSVAFTGGIADPDCGFFPLPFGGQRGRLSGRWRDDHYNRDTRISARPGRY